MAERGLTDGEEAQDGLSPRASACEAGDGPEPGSGDRNHPEVCRPGSLMQRTLAHFSSPSGASSSAQAEPLRMPRMSAQRPPPGFEGEWPPAPPGGGAQPPG